MKLEPQCKTQEQLFIEMARVCRMCEMTKVLIWDCVKLASEYGIEREFTASPSMYEFAIAIVEGKPVFRGDELYDNNGIKRVIVKVASPFDEPRLFWQVSKQMCEGLHLRDFSWLPPKPKTLTIELPYDDVIAFANLTDYMSLTSSFKSLSSICGNALDKL